MNTGELTPGEKPGHWLHIAGDSAASVEITPEDIGHYKRLVAEALALFGARHYENYHFLLTLSDHIPFNGLEHHESSDNRTAERAFLDENVPVGAAVAAVVSRIARVRSSSASLSKRYPSTQSVYRPRPSLFCATTRYTCVPILTIRTGLPSMSDSSAWTRGSSS